MSNHTGSYMLCDILGLLNEADVWAHMSRTDMQKLIANIVTLASYQYDCNSGEILEGHEAFGLCCNCLEPFEQLRRGMCPACNKHEFGDE